MSSTANTSGPPGPPGPPPPPGAKKPQDVSRYQGYLGKRGIQAAAGDLHEEERMRVGTWRFYYRGAPGMKNDAVALDDAGTVASVDDKSHWHALLSAPGIDAKGAHERLVWLFGKAAPIDQTYKLRDEGAAAKVGAPTLKKADDGAITFAGWVVYPPNMQTPYLLRVTAPKSGAATMTNTVWNKL